MWATIHRNAIKKLFISGTAMACHGLIPGQHVAAVIIMLLDCHFQ